MIITLDGPSGSGKSTLAQLLAQKLSSFYINSGFLYRSLGYVLVKNFGYDEEKLRDPDLADVESVLTTGDLVYDYHFDHGHVTVTFRGEDITGLLKQVEVSHYASLIARHLEVRKLLKKYQRNLVSQKGNTVAEGRDCGSDVFSDADLKFFVMASDEVRARRLQKDQRSFGKELSYNEALEFIITRDERDRKRKHAPLVRPAGSILIDTSDLTVEEALNQIIGQVKG